MALHSRRARQLRTTPAAGDRTRPTLQRSVRAAATASVLGLALGVAACGMNVQTNKPYNPADGINLDAGNVHIRNVMVLSRTPGTGYLSASLVTGGQDVLTGVSGVSIKSDGSDGGALVGAVPDPVAFGGNALVVLTDRPLITLTSADLAPGLDASLVLKFSKAGDVSVRVPVVDANRAPYATISPSASPTATPSS